MARKLPVVLTLFLFPSILMAGAGDSTWIQKVITKNGTYLPGTEPMPCGSSELDDDAILRIKSLFEKVAHWPNFRIGHKMGTWEKDVSSCRVPLGGEQCTDLLKQAGVDFKKLAYAEGITNPVELGSKVNGIKFFSEEPLVMDCNLALSIVKMTEILKAKKVKKIGVMSVHRPKSKYSFHSLGLGIDINWFKSSQWGVSIWVQTHFQKRTKQKTCKYKPETGKGRFLMDIACTLWEEKVFNTILTPNYNAGHYNHFHFDLRPGDNRFYVN